MLILSRRKGEAVLMPGHGIEVRVLRITGSRVQLGFNGPGGTAFVREELLDGNQGFHAEPAHGQRAAWRGSWRCTAVSSWLRNA